MVFIYGSLWIETVFYNWTRQRYAGLNLLNDCLIVLVAGKIRFFGLFMKASTINELKQELVNTPAQALVDLCLRLARFKKENKELLTYLLFEVHDTSAYIQSVKDAMALQFADINKSNVYFIKKTLRKVLRTARKYIRYSGLPTVEVELLIYFCQLMKDLNISINKNPVLLNMYEGQLKKINKALTGLHEDLQYDYLKSLNKL
jgi:hypothetical protein